MVFHSTCLVSTRICIAQHPSWKSYQARLHRWLDSAECWITSSFSGFVVIWRCLLRIYSLWKSAFVPCLVSFSGRTRVVNVVTRWNANIMSNTMGRDNFTPPLGPATPLQIFNATLVLRRTFSQRLPYAHSLEKVNNSRSIWQLCGMSVMHVRLDKTRLALWPSTT